MSGDSGPSAAEVNLRGVPCPLNWANAKVCLEALPRGAALAFVVDDPRSVRDMPRAAEAEGYAVLSVEELEDAWKIIIEK